MIRVKSSKAKVTATFNYAGSKLTPQACRPKVKQVHCFKVKRGHSTVPPGTEIKLLAWNKGVITDTFGPEAAADRKVIKVRLG